MRGSALTVAVIVLLALAVVGGAIVLLLADDGGPADPDPVVETSGMDDPDARPDEGRTDIDVPDTPFPRPEKGPPFVPEGAEELVARVDFDFVGESVRTLIPLLRRYAVQVARLEELDPETHGKLEDARGGLAEHLMGLEPDLGDEVPHGVYCHPLIVANTIDAVLTRLKRPLSDAQMHRIQVLLDAAWEQDRERRRGPPPDFRGEWFAARMIEQAEPRQAFYDEVLPVLTKAQEAKLRPVGLQGRVGLDLFSTGWMWDPMTDFLPLLGNETEFGVMVTDMICPRVGIPPRDDAHHEGMQAAVREWRRTLPDDYPIDRVAGPLDSVGLVETRLCPLYARETVRLLEKVLANSPPEYGMRFRIAPIVFVIQREAL